MIVPAVAYVVGFSFYPSLLAVYKSFQTPSSNGRLTLLNYKELVTFGIYPSIYNTIVVTLAALALQFAIALVIATMLTKAFRGKSFFQVSVLIPFSVATIVAAYTFSNFFATPGGYADALIGLLNYLTLGVFHLHAPQWTGYNYYWLNVFALVFSDSWKNTPIVAMILAAGMSTLPQDMYAQAKVDGAGPLSRFARITLPNLSSYLAIALVIRGISEFNIFAMALLIFPHVLLTTLAYGLYSSNDVSISYAAAVVLLGFILVFAAIVTVFRNRSSIR